MPLADARALCPDLRTIEADPAADAAFLDAIAAWCERFTPVVAPAPPDGLFLDIGGCAHLFGGEHALLKSLQSRLKAQGLAARGAIAPTPGAAHALARFGDKRIVSAEELEAALAPLPVRALRLSEDALALLRRLGLKHVAQIAAAPRAPFSARAGQAAMLRLDQAYGRAPEALTPRRPPPPLFAFRRLLEPVLTSEAVLLVTRDLCAELLAGVEQRGAGVLRLRLVLFDVDGRRPEIRLGLSRPEHSIDAILRLFRDRLERMSEQVVTEFGFEALRLDAIEIGEIVEVEDDLEDNRRRDAHALARLQDALVVRLGAERVLKPAFLDAHAPERAGGWRHDPPPQRAPDAPPQDGVQRRPLTLFARAQPIEAMAEVPDGPPMRFRWRRVVREVARAEGPERIAPHWLRAPDSRTRDYYRVEDVQGRRYWLYREGFYSGESAPRWFIHGLFA
jgi:protein ImuB